MIINNKVIILNKEEVKSSKYHNYKPKCADCRGECTLQNCIKQSKLEKI